MESEFFSLITPLLILTGTPPFFLGVIAKTKAFFAGRKGPPLLQAYYDLAKLLRKGAVVSRSASWLLRIAPVAILASLLVAGLLLPIVGEAPLHFEGDLILFVYLLAVGRFFTILAAQDVGSSFEGMGASREAAFGALSELSFFLGLLVLSILHGTVSLNGLFEATSSHLLVAPVIFLLFGTFFFTLLTENSRMPIDDPTTHLELTMIHEVMILDYSGPDLGLILYGASVKLFLFMVFVSQILWPPVGYLGPLAIGALLLKVTGVAIGIGVVEAAVARLRLIKIPQLLIANFVVTALALLVMLFGKGIG